MRYLMLYRPAKGLAEVGPPNPEHMAEMGKLIEEMKREGVLLDTGALLSNTMGARVQRSGSTFTVTDGALPELEKPIVGYALVQVESTEKLIALTKRFLMVAGEGDSEILPLMDGPA